MSRRRRLYDLKTVARTYASGHGRGLVQRDLSRSEWDISGTCERPVPVEMEGAAARLLGGHMVRQAGGAIHTLVLQTKCRKCPPCLRARATLWAYRAVEELSHAPRTWFATFTFRPSEHFRMRVQTSARLRAGGVEFETLSPLEAQRELSATYGAELTKYFKRVRKQSGVPLRYVLVQEAHLSGLPHFHALIHEVNPDEPLRHATLAAKWELGYTQFKLCDGVKSAWYVAKYLAKSVLSRVRASFRYGQNGLMPKGENGPRRIPPPKRVEKRETAFMVSIKQSEKVFISNDNLDQSNPTVSRSASYGPFTATRPVWAAPPSDRRPPLPGETGTASVATTWREAYQGLAALAKALSTTLQPIGLGPAARSNGWVDGHANSRPLDPLGADGSGCAQSSQ